MSRVPRVAVIADTDSRWKWGISTAKSINPNEQPVSFLRDSLARPSARQLREADAIPEQVIPINIAELPKAIREHECDALVVSLSGGGCQAVLQAYIHTPCEDYRPVLISGHVGLVYEKVLEGALLRGGYDIVLANSTELAKTLRGTYETVGLDPDSVVESPLAFLTDEKLSRVSGHHPYTVTFAAQPSVPRTRSERQYVVNRLAQHAQLFPDRQVILKLRGQPGELVTHNEMYSLAGMFKKLGVNRPPNFILDSGAMRDVLAKTDLLITVSSTAAMEAWKANIPAGILTDFGVRDMLGTPYFLESGAFMSFNDLDEGVDPEVSKTWLQDHGLSVSTQPLDQVVLQKMNQQPLPQVKSFYNLHNAPIYLKKTLADYGMGTDGLPLRENASQSVPRRTLKSTSRILLKFGQTVVLPKLKEIISA